MLPEISVIVPVYNVAPYLPQCLDSLAAQQGPAMEFILVDDGSADGSLAICRQYAQRDPRFICLHKENGGVSSARNMGLMHARGAWIGFADSDDWLEADLFDKLYQAARREQADVAMCGYYEYLPDPKAAPLIKGTEPAEPCGAAGAAFQILRRTGYFTALWNKLFRREVLGQPCMTFDETLQVGEDETWLLRVLPSVKRAVFVPEPLYHWRSRGDSASRRAAITPSSMSVLRAKQMAETLVTRLDPALVPLTRSRLLNDCYHLKVIAYRTGDRAAMKCLRTAFARVRRDWLLSRDVPLLRKGKVAAMALLMALHLPSAWVDRVYDIRRSHG